MNDDLLKRLRPEARALLTSDSIGRSARGSFAEYEERFERNLSLEPLAEVIDAAMTRDRQFSDSWLAPRVHSTLRLYRREAADPGVWLFLAARFPEYIRWRWENKDGQISAERIVGSTNRQALARLWWGAEVSRNGHNYAPTHDLFWSQEMVNWVLDTRAFQNRPAALAFIDFLGPDAPDSRIRITAKALRHALTTIALDALAPDDGPDLLAIEEWVDELPDVTLMGGENMPDGPPDCDVPTARIEAVKRVLEHIAPRPTTAS